MEKGEARKWRGGHSSCSVRVYKSTAVVDFSDVQINAELEKLSYYSPIF